MKEIDESLLVNYKGGMSGASALGGACAAVVLIGIFGGFAGLIGAFIVGPSVCGTGIALGILGR